jgi:hypothetical protein
MLNAVVLVHGKEADPKVVQIGPRTFITPGSLRGAKRTVGLIEQQDKTVTFSAFTLDGKEVISKQPIQLGSGKTKISVK